MYNNYSNSQYNNSYNPYNPFSVNGIGASSFQSQRQEIVKVNGREGANAYPLSPNSSTLLLDINQPIIYLKQSDGGGYCNVTAYTITPLEQEQNTIDASDLEKRIKRLEELYESNTANVKQFRKQQSAQSDKSN